MLSLFKRYRELIVVGALLLYPLGRFLAAGSKEREVGMIDRVVLGISTPLQRGLSWTVDGTAYVWTHYAALRGARELSDELTVANGKLRNELNELTELRAENERLKRLLNFAENVQGQEIPARIVGVGPSTGPLTVRLDRGEDAGVRKGMPVVTADGVVGQIIRATGGSADVLLITDASSYLGVRNQRSRARALAKGRGDRKEVTIDLQFALRTDDMEEGDAIVTAGTDGIFPSGLMVGRLTAIERKSSGPLTSAKIIPAVDVNRLEEVFVLGAAAIPLQGVQPVAVQPKVEEKP